ncbi:MAG: ABC transporter ATP-binding protein [Micropruina sp.]|nr:ABC transporter ATP-binding protein [Micropruina sp.]
MSHVSLDIPKGQRVAVTGASGSGKSTLLHVIGGLDRPTSGEIVVNEVRLDTAKERELPRYRRTVGFVFQRFNLVPSLNVHDNVIAPLIPYRVPFDKSARAIELLERVGLGERIDASVAALSGGQQQRVAIARALVAHPSLLLADEPTGALDSRTGHEILDLIEELQADTGMTVLVATHDHAIAARADRVLTMADGVLISDV